VQVPYDITAWNKLDSYLRPEGTFLYSFNPIEKYPIYPIYASTRTQYISTFSDKNPVIALNSYSFTIDVSLNTFLTQAQIDDLYVKFKMITRKVFDNFIVSVLAPIVDIPIPTLIEVYGNPQPITYTLKKEILKEALRTNMVELFNKANLEEALKANMTPINWEGQKVTAFYAAQAQAEIEKNVIFQPIIESGLSTDQKAFIRSNLEARYVKLPKIADEAIDLQRTIAIQLLLDQEKFQLVSDIILFYETLTDTMKNVLQTQV
jgi:hypothetical protein